MWGGTREDKEFLWWVPAALVRLTSWISPAHGFLRELKSLVRLQSDGSADHAERARQHRQLLFYWGAWSATGVLWQVILVLLLYFLFFQLGLVAYISGIWRSDSGEMPVWIFWLGSSRVEQLGMYGVLAWLLTHLVGPWGFYIGFIGVWLFFMLGFLAGPGALVLLLALRTGLQTHTWRKVKPLWLYPRDWWGGIALGVLLSVGSLFLSKVVWDNLTYIFQVDVFRLDQRLPILALSYAWWSVLIALVSLLYYHFYWLLAVRNKYR
jgi:hypothetical protein